MSSETNCRTFWSEASRKQLLAHPGLGFVEAGLAGFRPGIDPQDMVPERGVENITHPPGGQGKGGGFQVGRELGAGEGPHQAAGRGFGGLRLGPGQRLEALLVLLEPPTDVAGLGLGGHQDLAEGDGLAALEFPGVAFVVGDHVGLPDLDSLKDVGGEQLLHRLLLVGRAGVGLGQAARARFEHEHPLLEKRVEEGREHGGAQALAALGLEPRHVLRELASAHHLVVEGEDHRVDRLTFAAGDGQEQGQDAAQDARWLHALGVEPPIIAVSAPRRLLEPRQEAGRRGGHGLARRARDAQSPRD